MWRHGSETVRVAAAPSVRVRCRLLSPRGRWEGVTDRAHEFRLIFLGAKSNIFVSLPVEMPIDESIEPGTGTESTRSGHGVSDREAARDGVILGRGVRDANPEGTIRRHCVIPGDLRTLTPGILHLTYQVGLLDWFSICAGPARKHGTRLLRRRNPLEGGEHDRRKRALIGRSRVPRL